MPNMTICQYIQLVFDCKTEITIQASSNHWQHLVDNNDVIQLWLTDRADDSWTIVSGLMLNSGLLSIR